MRQPRLKMAPGIGTAQVLTVVIFTNHVTHHKLIYRNSYFYLILLSGAEHLNVFFFFLGIV